MLRVYYAKQNEGVEIDCPKCGSDAVVNNQGVICSNKDCSNSAR